MFEGYTETARKVVFFARYEASQFGCKSIETEHLLLGIIRSDGPLVLRLLKAPEKIESIRAEIEKRFSPRRKVSTSVNLPLSQESKRALAYGAEEAERLNQGEIGPQHLLLGLLREKTCPASKILTENGLTASQVKEEAIRLSPARGPDTAAEQFIPPAELARDLTAAARNDALGPTIGRERELERAIQILSRRSKCNPVLIGEAGVGKNAIVHGLAQRIADGGVPAALAERPILAMDASSLFSPEQGEGLAEIVDRSNAILYVRGLFDLAGKGTGWGRFEAIHVLESHLASRTLQCIATGSPAGYRQTMEKAETLASHFEVVGVLPPTEEEAIQILASAKEQYEKFHDVVVTKEAIETAVSASRWFLRDRHLPERAIDLIDEAGARVRLRCEGEPWELAETGKRIRRIVRDMENAIANHDFNKAKLHAEDERNERLKLQRLQNELKRDPPNNTIGPQDIVEAIAGRAGLAVSLVKSVLQTKEVDQLELIAKELAVQIPLGDREWVEGLTAYLAGCSAEDAEKLAQAIQTAKARLDSQRDK